MGEIILKGDNNWTIWFKKWIPAVGMPLLATGIIYTADYIQVNPLPIDPKYVFVSGLIVTVLYQIANLIKHG